MAWHAYVDVAVELPGGIVGGNVVHPVRWSNRKVTEKWSVLVGAYEFECFAHDRVVRIGFTAATSLVACEYDFFAVTNQVRWV